MQGLTAEQQSQKMADLIKNNPNMPQSAKDMALARINAHAPADPGKKK
jgi:hypothetical protein